MKQRWTRLVQLFKIKNDSQMNHAFMKHHKNADEIVFDKDKNIMAAIYFTPMALNKQSTKALFAEIQKRTLFANELESSLAEK